MNKNYLKDTIKIQLDFEEIEVIKGFINIYEVSEDTDPIVVPDSDKCYSLNFLSEDGTVIASRDNISHSVWSSIKNGKIKNGDVVGIEIECIALVSPDKPDTTWTSIFAEALCVLYSRVKLNQQNNITIHKIKE